MKHAKSASRTVAAVTILALAATFTLAPTFAPLGSMDAAAYAKGGNGGGNGGGKGNGGDKAGKGKDKSSKATKSRGSSKAKRSGSGGLGASLKGLFKKKDKKVTRKATKPRKAKTQAATASTDTGALKPNQKGKWNAANANQNALDAHIRNGNFNGTIGDLAYYQLAGLAASDSELTPDQQAALDALIGDVTTEITDDELAALVNGDGSDDLDGDGFNDTLPNYEVADGIATCVSNCDGPIEQDANEVIADYVDEANAEAEAEARQNLLADAEQNIIDNSNKPTEGIEDQLLDELAAALGFERLMEDPEVDPELDPGIDPDLDDELPLETAAASN